MNPISRTDNYFLKIHSNFLFSSTLGLPKGIFAESLPIKISKAFFHSTWAADSNFLDIIALKYWANDENYEIPHCGALSTPHLIPLGT